MNHSAFRVLWPCPAWVLLDKKNIIPPLRDRLRNRAADHAPANNQNVRRGPSSKTVFLSLPFCSLPLYFLTTFLPVLLLTAPDLIKECLAFDKFRFTAIVHRVLRALARFISVAP